MIESVLAIGDLSFGHITSDAIVGVSISKLYAALVARLGNVQQLNTGWTLENHMAKRKKKASARPKSSLKKPGSRSKGSG